MNNLLTQRPFFVGIFLLLSVSACHISSAQGDQVCLRETCFNVEVVSKGPELSRGLQFRPSLAPDAGMLFVFSEDRRHSFWMKDTLIPLDIIWLNASRQVVFIQQNAPPCEEDPCTVYTSPVKAGYVLELNAGKTAEIGLKEGDRLTFRLKTAPSDP